VLPGLLPLPTLRGKLHLEDEDLLERAWLCVQRSQLVPRRLMGKQKKTKQLAGYLKERIGVYRCPKGGCGHRWEQVLNRDAECPKCGEVQGPVVIK